MDGKESEIVDARAALRMWCQDYGDNDWPPGLHLVDVIDKHLMGHVTAKLGIHDRLVEALKIIAAGRDGPHDLCRVDMQNKAQEMLSELSR